MKTCKLCGKNKYDNEIRKIMVLKLERCEYGKKRGHSLYACTKCLINIGLDKNKKCTHCDYTSQNKEDFDDRGLCRNCENGMQDAIAGHD